MPILIDTAELAGLAIEGPLYGVFLCLFVICTYDLYRRRKRHETQLSWPMALAGISLILLATARFIVDVTYIFIAFIQTDPRDARLGFLQDVTVPLFTAKHSLFITSLFIGDLFVNYRCWVVWGKNFWVVFIPLVLSVLAAGCGYYTIWAYRHFPDQTIFSQQRPLTIFFSGSLVANAMATSLLAYRIWSMDRAAVNALEMEEPEHKLTPIVRIILESGLINAAFLFAFVMTLVFGSSSLEIMSEMGTPMCGIIFSIVIFRVGLRRRNRFAPTTQGMSTISWAAAAKSVGNRFGIGTVTTERNAQRSGAPTASPIAVRMVEVRSSSTTKQDRFDMETVRSADSAWMT